MRSTRVWGALPVQGRSAPLVAAPRSLARCAPRRLFWRAGPRVALGGHQTGPAGAGRRRATAPLCAFALDPDAYELELDDEGYDSDDYELSWQQHAAAAAAGYRGPAAATTSAEGAAGGSSSGSRGGVRHRPSRAAALHRALGAQQQQAAGGEAALRSDGLHPREAIDQGFNLFLLFGAAVDVSVSRLQAAALAAGHAGWQLVREGVRVAQRQLHRSPAGRSTQRWRRQFEDWTQDVPEDAWGKMLWLWDRPPVQKLRLTISMANLSIRLPALLALVATQVGLLASQVSLPMLAPLLLGTGMLMRSIRSNASFLFPRIGLLVVLIWLLWFANSVVQNTVAYLRRQGAIDQRLAGGLITASECTVLLASLVILLSMLGVNVSALLLPAGVAAAIAAKDLSHNFLAGFFLFIVQPFKLGDKVAVSYSAPGAPGTFAGAWFEGVCERVDLRYTMIRQGRRRLMVPNSAFLTREFIVMDEVPAGAEPAASGPASGGEGYAEFMTADNRHILQYMYGPPVHQELMRQPQQDPNGAAPQEAAHSGSAPNGAHGVPPPPHPMQQQQPQTQQQQAMAQQEPHQQQQPNGGAGAQPYSSPPSQQPSGAAHLQGYPYPPLGQPYGGRVPQTGYYDLGAYQDRPMAMWQGPGGGAPFAQQQRTPWGGYYYGQQGLQPGSAPAPPARSPEQPQ